MIVMKLKVHKDEQTKIFIMHSSANLCVHIQTKSTSKVGYRWVWALVLLLETSTNMEKIKHPSDSQGFVIFGNLVITGTT